MSQALTAVLLLSGVAGFGTVLTAPLRERLSLPVPTSAALVPLTGLAVLGGLTLVVGHLRLLGPWLPWAAAAGGVALAGWRRHDALGMIRETWGAAWSQTRAHPVPTATALIALVLAVLAAYAPPNRIDEIEYHWPAPLAWAQAGGWNDSLYRHVDGFPLMEILYTAAAVHESWFAAHLLHLTTLLAAGLATAGAARALGARGTAPVAAAAMLAPVVWDGAYAAYNDTAVGAFLIGAVAVVLGTRSDRRAIAVAALLVAVAISIKPTAVAGVGVVGLVLLFQARGISHGWGAALRRVLRPWLVLAATGIVTFAFWSVRQWWLTGNLVDPTLSGPPSAEALSRLPSQAEQLLAPLMPLVTGVIGAQEPWGGRTSLVLQIFLIPALVYVAWRRGRVLQRFGTLALPAWAHWIVLGLVNVRTRFHIISWVMLIAAARVAMEDASDRHPRLARWLELAWTAAVLAGAVDVSFEMIRVIGRI